MCSVPGKYSGGAADGYAWTQTLSEIELKAPIPRGPPERSVRCTFSAKRLDLSFIEVGSGAEQQVEDDSDLRRRLHDNFLQNEHDRLIREAIARDEGTRRRMEQLSAAKTMQQEEAQRQGATLQHGQGRRRGRRLCLRCLAIWHVLIHSVLD